MQHAIQEPPTIGPGMSASRRRLAIGWLLLAIASLIIAGLLAGLLVLSRTPGLDTWFPWTDFFHVALVVHVDLSVLIWFLAFAGLLWSLGATAAPAVWERTSLGLAWIGTAVVAAAPFSGEAQPLMNNYVPVLEQKWFLAGLTLFAAGIVLNAGGVAALRSKTLHGNVISIGLYFAAWTVLIAAGAVAVSFFGLHDLAHEGQAFYEFLFWGGGHVLQITFTVLILSAWFWLLHASGGNPGSDRRLTLLLGLAALPSLMAVGIYGAYPVQSAEHRIAFTELMRFGGLASLPAGLMVVYALIRSPKASAEAKPLRSALIASITLFAAGGIIGFLIHGINVVIPAHYHGSIVGVTLALMGLTYYLLPALGFGTPLPRAAVLQPYLYGGGQLLHILGLAWSGGYGVQRKTAGAAQGLHNFPELAGMALMGLGGLIAVLGGILFLVIAVHALWHRRLKE